MVAIAPTANDAGAAAHAGAAVELNERERLLRVCALFRLARAIDSNFCDEFDDMRSFAEAAAVPYLAILLEDSGLLGLGDVKEFWDWLTRNNLAPEDTEFDDSETNAVQLPVGLAVGIMGAMNGEA